MRRETATSTKALASVEAQPLAGDGLPLTCLLVVATPIGNLSDLSPRASEALRSASLIACEDRRVSRALFDCLHITPATVNIEKHHEPRAVVRVLDHLAAGGRCALLTDAGTPAISDPGHLVVDAVRTAGFRVVPIPGPSAFVALASVAGFHPAPLWFEGFLPAREAPMRRRLRDLLALRAHVLFYEAPHRIAETAVALAQLAPLRSLCVGRELTKLHEECAVLEAGGLSAWLAASAMRTRGEYCLMVEAAKVPEGEASAQGGPEQGNYLLNCEAMMSTLLRELPPARAARTLARMTGDARTDWYKLALRLAADA